MRIKILKQNGAMPASCMTDLVNCINSQAETLGLSISHATIYLGFADQYGYPAEIDDLERDLVFNSTTGNIRDEHTDGILANAYEYKHSDIDAERIDVERMKTAGKELRKRRENRQLTIRAMSYLTGIDGRLLCDYENGLKEPSEDNSEAINQAIESDYEEKYTTEDVREVAKKLITNRPLTRNELSYICKYMEMGMCDSAIVEAFQTTISHMGRVSWQYMDRIVCAYAKKGKFA